MAVFWDRRFFHMGHQRRAVLVACTTKQTETDVRHGPLRCSATPLLGPAEGAPAVATGTSTR